MLRRNPDLRASNTQPPKKPSLSAPPSSLRSEHDEQVALFAWAGRRVGMYPDLEWLLAIPNGGHRFPAVAAKLKAEGVKAGVPDILLPVARRGYNNLWIEMKVGKNTQTERQQQWMVALESRGNCVRVCYSAEAAIEVLTWYLT